MASTPSEVEIKGTKDADNSIIISDQNLGNMLPHQLKNMKYKVMCGCECCIYSKIMHSSLLTWRNCHMKHLKYTFQNAQNRRSVEISRRISETYKNSVRTHCCHIYNNAAYIAMETMCNCTSKHCGITKWMCLLSCCDKYPKLSYPVRRQIKIQQTCVQQYLLMFTITPHIVLCTAYWITIRT